MEERRRRGGGQEEERRRRGGGEVEERRRRGGGEVEEASNEPIFWFLSSFCAITSRSASEQDAMVIKSTPMSEKLTCSHGLRV